MVTMKDSSLHLCMEYILIVMVKMKDTPLHLHMVLSNFDGKDEGQVPTSLHGLCYRANYARVKDT